MASEAAAKPQRMYDPIEITSWGYLLVPPRQHNAHLLEDMLSRRGEVTGGELEGHGVA